MKITARLAAALFAVVLTLTAGMNSASAQYAQSKIQDIQPGFQLAQSTKKKSGGGGQRVFGTCGGGSVPCGLGCCLPGYRCGDSKCHKRGVTGATGIAPRPKQTQ